MAGKITIRKEAYGPRNNRKFSKNWYIHYTDRFGKRQEVPGYRDKRATERLSEIILALDIAAEAGNIGVPPDASLMKNVRELPEKTQRHLAKHGFIGKDIILLEKPLTDHVVKWAEYLGNTQASKEYCKQAPGRIRRIIKECEFVRLSDMERSKVQAWGHAFTTAGNSTETLASYFRSLKSFCNWLAQEGVISSSPMKHLKNTSRVPTTQKKSRRALSMEKVQFLLGIAEASTELVRGMMGPDRAILYQVALETGLRWSELFSLTIMSFSLDSDPATVTVEAAHSKRRREDVIPLRKLLVEKLKDYFAGRAKTEKAFKGMLRDKGAKMLRFDLDKAGIPVITDEGEIDFHSLRHTFITHIVMAGANPKMAQTLARHSNIELTLGRYSHVELKQQLETIEKTLAQQEG